MTESIYEFRLLDCYGEPYRERPVLYLRESDPTGLFIKIGKSTLVIAKVDELKCYCLPPNEAEKYFQEKLRKEESDKHPSYTYVGNTAYRFNPWFRELPYETPLSCLMRTVS